MSYVVHGLLYKYRRDAMRATIEGWLWADGENTPGEIARIVATPDDAEEQDTAKNLAYELVHDWGGSLSTNGGEEEVPVEEWTEALRGIVGVKYADPEEDARILWGEEDARDIESEDPSLVVRSQWFPRDEDHPAPR